MLLLLLLSALVVSSLRLSAFGAVVAVIYVTVIAIFVNVDVGNAVAAVGVDGVVVGLVVVLLLIMILVLVSLTLQLLVSLLLPVVLLFLLLFLLFCYL